MPTFTPPTYEQAFIREEGSNQAQGLMRHYDFSVGYSVLITGGVATTYPGRTVPTQDDIDAADSGSGLGGKAAFIGGRVYEVTEEEGSLLSSAGYTVEGVPPFPRFQSLESSVVQVGVSFPTATVQSGAITAQSSLLTVTPTFGSASIASSSTSQPITASLFSVSVSFPNAGIAAADGSTYSDTYSNTY